MNDVGHPKCTRVVWVVWCADLLAFVLARVVIAVGISWPNH